MFSKFIKKLDLLSPPITLYFKGESIHTTIFSGILSIISYMITTAFGFYYTKEYILASNPLIYFYTRYVEDAGIFPLNSKSMFHFIRFADTDKNQNVEIDFDSIRFIGLQTSIDVYIGDNDLTKYTHWLYGPCNDGDVGNLKPLINQAFPEKAACIREYFDINTQKYYNTGEQNFKWPIIEKGCSNQNAVNYGIIMELCRNNSLKNNCKSQEEINNYLKSKYYALYFIDQYADVLNYENPLIKYFYKLPNGFFTDSFTVNHLNFNPSMIISHKGILFDFKKEIHTYQFTQNEKISMEKENTNIIASCYFWMQNNMQYYERNYDKIQDLMGDIGGFGGFINLFAQIINYFMSRYAIFVDTEKLILNTGKQFKNNDYNRKVSIRSDNKIINQLKLNINNKKFKDSNINNRQSSIYNILLKDKVDIYKICNNNQEAKSENWKNLNKNKKEKESKESLNNINNNKLGKKLNKNNMNIASHSNINSSIGQLETNKKTIEYEPIETQNLSFLKYLYFLIYNNNPKINYYENLRAQLISEENMIQNHININNLLRFCQLENIDPFEIKSSEQKMSII